MTELIKTEELELLKELIFFIYGFTFIMLIISITMYLAGDLIVSEIYEKFSKGPRCNTYEKVKWCECENQIFNGDYVEPKCTRCDNKME